MEKPQTQSSVRTHNTLDGSSEWNKDAKKKKKSQPDVTRPLEIDSNMHLTINICHIVKKLLELRVWLRSSKNCQP